jgi:protoporphyrinogen oxidase
MQAIAEQIAAHLNPNQVRLNTSVEKIVGKTIFLKNGTAIEAEKIVVATDANTAARLLNSPIQTAFNSTDCLYFESDKHPPEALGHPLSISAEKSFLIVNSNTDELIDHLIVLSDVVPNYAPTNRVLISVSVVGKNDLSNDDLREKVEAELTKWFGVNQKWRYLKTYRIPEALPQFFADSPTYNSLKINDFTFRCGDYTAYPSLNAAMKSGREVAELIN